MPNVRELLESAAPYDARPHASAPAAELRRLGQRRQRRSQAVGVVIGVTAVALSIVGIVRFVVPLQGQVAPSTTTGPSPRSSFTPQPVPSPTGPDLGALAGTRWIPDLIGSGVSTVQAYPDEPGNLPRALMTFEPGHVLVLDYIERGRTTTVRGTWAATSDTPALDARTHGSLRLSLIAPPHAPSVLVLLLNRFSIVSSYAMYVPVGPPPSLEALTMSAYENASGVAVFDLVKPGAVLPSAYPRRP